MLPSQFSTLTSAKHTALPGWYLARLYILLSAIYTAAASYFPQSSAWSTKEPANIGVPHLVEVLLEEQVWAGSHVLSAFLSLPQVQPIFRQL